VEDEEGDRLIYLGGGPLAALLLGVVLVPMRGVTSASNFTFAFMALIIVVAELGGRGAALATALSSSLSLDFFLTEPYRRLAIADKHDVIAFLGLTACGLVAAAVGSQRGERAAALRATRAQLALVHSGLEQLEKGTSADVGLKRVLDAFRGALPLGAAVVRDTRGNLRAATDRAYGMPVPARDLGPDALAALAAGEPLPREGARLALVLGGRRLGWLDVWGNDRPASAQARQTLGGVAPLLAVILSQADPTLPGGGTPSRAGGLSEAPPGE
jgi:hypothetical protein